MDAYTEKNAIEIPAIKIFEKLGYRHINAFYEVVGEQGTLGRESRRQVVLERYLQLAIERLNPSLPSQVLQQAMEIFTANHTNEHLGKANRTIYNQLKDGIPVSYKNDDDHDKYVLVQVIDWQQPEQNDLLLVSQLWIATPLYERRPDLIGFVNGIPLIVIELKAHDVDIRDGFDKNINDYRDTIPHLFWYNAFIIVSNGLQSRIGSTTASWENYYDWKRIESEDEQGDTALDRMIQGTCAPQRLLDIIANFTLFTDHPDGVKKVVAQNHQYIGVNHVIRKMIEQPQEQRLGVFWHTQGSGKSIAMIFFSQKVLWTIPGNWTFLIVTDREELDDQIYKTFVRTGIVPPMSTNDPNTTIQAQSGGHLQQLLGEDHRYIFTLIQKFHTDTNQPIYPVLSERSDIIVITDEAHRTEYGIFAHNLRRALPNAAFIGFTGTPLIAEERERTREEFGEYVSIYNFRDAILDGTTVPLYYENRIPTLQLANDQINAQMEALLENEDGSEEEKEARIAREFAREYDVITADDRLETIADDIVKHLMSRGERGKTMVVSIDKITTLRMYHKVKRHWEQVITELHREMVKTREPELRKIREERVRYFKETEMYVVLTFANSQNEIEDARRYGIEAELKTHRENLMKLDLKERFKDPNDPFRIVFVCAMWIVGFDVPSLNTIYLDKPARNHTLMQTIARANRKYRDKTSGLIVDYIGVFRNLQKALSIYGSDSGGRVAEGDMPVAPKEEQVKALDHALQLARDFCAQHTIDIDQGMQEEGLDRLRTLASAADAIQINDMTIREWLALADDVAVRYRAILPDLSAAAYTAQVAYIIHIARRIRKNQATDNKLDTSIAAQVAQIIDDSIIADQMDQPTGMAHDGHYQIAEDLSPYHTVVDISALDIEEIRRRFANQEQHAAIIQTRSRIAKRVTNMVRQNPTRIDFQAKLQRIIDLYNEGKTDNALILEQLIQMNNQLNEETERHIREHLTEDELTIFDLLVADRPLTEEERNQVKPVARELLARINQIRQQLDWSRRQRSKADAKITIRDIVATQLPASYTPEDRQTIIENMYRFILEHSQAVG